MRAYEENLALLALATRPKFSWSATRLKIEQLGSATAVLDESYDGHLLSADRDDELRAAAARVVEWEAAGIHVASLVSEHYPAALRSVHDAPPVLYWRGTHSPSDRDAVAIVGTRRPSRGGEEFASSLARMLAEAGTPVVSGLARGIDSQAMRAALAAGGRTVGVIGTGHGVYYPRENRDLQDELSSHHLVMSQFAPGSPPTKQTFPMRNVVMSGFSSATVIAEAGETSGTRIQARAAVKHGRPLILSAHVAQSVDWARELLESGYDIAVAATPDEAAAHIVDLHARRDAAAGGWALGALLSA
jgi:DNA processing protein